MLVDLMDWPSYRKLCSLGLRHNVSWTFMPDASLLVSYSDGDQRRKMLISASGEIKDDFQYPIKD